ncbi:MAG: aldo/keto reductase [Gammaproteobacteria bacterium]|nr:aldo/keto reductase [Gammaproteobacteria bacterium]
MNSRAFGKTNVFLSPITLGTMRFEESRFEGSKEAAAFLEYLYERGVNTYHTSSEYETHSFFCDIFQRFKQGKPNCETKHIVKLACPHFEESDFSAVRLEHLVDEQLKALQIEQIDIVQWLFRQKQNIDTVRIPKFENCADEVLSAFSRLKQSGKIKALSAFPYSLPFADAIKRHHFVDGFADYLNFYERNWVKPLHDLQLEHLGFLAIRPLFAGKLLTLSTEKKMLLEQFNNRFKLDHVEQMALAYPLLHPNVSSIILSLSSQKHADRAIEVGECISAEGDKEMFFAWSQCLDEACFSEAE